MDIIIRKYQSKDYLSLLKLLEKEYGSHIDQQTLEEKYLTESRTIIIAENDSGILVGCTFIELQKDFIRPKKIGFVTYVAVDFHYRKQGIGRKLMEYVEYFCRTVQCSAIELTSANFRSVAHTFYKSLGFTKKETTLFIKELPKSTMEDCLSNLSEGSEKK